MTRRRPPLARFLLWELLKLLITLAVMIPLQRLFIAF